MLSRFFIVSLLFAALLALATPAAGERYVEGKGDPTGQQECRDWLDLYKDTNASTLYVCRKPGKVGSAIWEPISGGSGHSDGANCAAGEIPLGVDASGVVQGCYEPAATDVTYTPTTGTDWTDWIRTTVPANVLNGLDALASWIKNDGVYHQWFYELKNPGTTTAGIAEAIDAACTAVGTSGDSCGIVQLKRGRSTLSTKVQVGGTVDFSSRDFGLTIRGHGKCDPENGSADLGGSCLVMADGSADDTVIEIAGSRGVVVRDVGLDADAAPDGGSPVAHCITVRPSNTGSNAALKNEIRNVYCSGATTAGLAMESKVAESNQQSDDWLIHAFETDSTVPVSIRLNNQQNQNTEISHLHSQSPATAGVQCVSGHFNLHDSQVQLNVTNSVGVDIQTACAMVRVRDTYFESSVAGYGIRTQGSRSSYTTVLEGNSFILTTGAVDWNPLSFGHSGGLVWTGNTVFTCDTCGAGGTQLDVSIAPAAGIDLYLWSGGNQYDADVVEDVTQNANLKHGIRNKGFFLNGRWLCNDGTGIYEEADGDCVKEAGEEYIAGAGGGGATPGGADTQVQFNDAGVFGGDPQLVYNKTTNTLTVGDASNKGSIIARCDNPGTMDCEQELEEDTAFSGTPAAGKRLLQARSDGLWQKDSAGTESRFLTTKDAGSECRVFEDLAAADDSYEIWIASAAVTITETAVHCRGICTTPATITWEDRAGNAMTGGGTASTGTGNTTWGAITAGGALVKGEGLAFDVTNTPNPETDEYTLCWAWTL